MLLCVILSVYLCLYHLSYCSVCPFFFFSIVFTACYHWWTCFLVWLLSLSFPFFYYYFIFLFLIIKKKYFNNFILFYLFISLFFSLFFWARWLTESWCSSQVSGLSLWSRRGKFRTLAHQRPPNPMWYQTAKALSEISISTPRPSFTQRPASYSAGHPMPKKLARQEHNPTH